MKWFQQGMALFLSWCLAGVCAPDGFAYQNAPPPQAVQQSPDQLQQLVAPIALYPDALIAQILPAAAYPDQIMEAERWMQQHKDLTGDSLAKEVDKQSWDPGVKALAQFPAVLANMNQNLAWTSELGDAYINQRQELTQAIQTMRQRAKQAGNLQTTDQEKVTTRGQDIVIQPASTEVVYVPQYDPWLVYGDPLAVFPGWYPYPGLFLDGPGIAFGLGFGVGFFGGFGWGWGHWGFDWHGGGRAVYNHNTYITNNTWRSNTTNNYNGYHAWAGGVAGTQNHASYGPNGGFHPNANYHPGVDTHYGPNGAYHPNEYFGPSGAIHHDVPGTGPANMPNGGNNGNHGLIGGNGGVQRAGEASPERSNSGWDQNRDGNQNRFAGAQQNRSRFSGDGGANRFESNRGRGSMAGRRAQRMGGERAHAEHRSGGRRR